MGLKRILAPVFVYVPDGPTDPGWGVTPPVDPGWGGGIPGGGHPWLPGYIGGPGIDNSLPGGGHISTGPIYPGGHPGHKPPGRPILPPSVDNGLPPSEPPHIWGGGRWEILDPGWGKPPLIGLIPPDPGFGVPETPPPTAGTPLPPTQPPTAGTPLPPTKPTHPGGGGGTWVPTDPDYGMPERPCGGGGKPHPPIWAFIPTPPDLSKPVPPATTPPATPK